jgi:hypothetical protein
MMIWEPRDMPSLRDDAAVWTKTFGRIVYLQAISEGMQDFRPPNMSNSDAATILAREEFKRLTHAELFHASASMTELIKVSSTTIPSFNLKPEDVPATHGFMYFSQPIQIIDYQDQKFPIVAITWGPMADSPYPDGAVWITTYVDHWDVMARRIKQGRLAGKPADQALRSMPRLAAHNECILPFSDKPLLDDPRGEGWNELPRLVRSTWMLMGQQISKTEVLTPSRALRRSCQRKGREAPSVRIIELRRPPASCDSAGDGHREYSHQWIVRGHWRKQWYPSVNDHRPVWIAPHIKGPEGAPLLGGDHVYSLKR